VKTQREYKNSPPQRGGHEADGVFKESSGETKTRFLPFIPSWDWNHIRNCGI